MDFSELMPNGLIELITVILQKIADISPTDINFDWLSALLNVVRPIIAYFVSLF